jgi:hypothetical protein
MSTTYVPGMCNIGPAEIKLRRRSGQVGVVLTIVLFMIFMVTAVAPPWRLFLFIPATLGATGYLQAKLHFCARFGFSGLFNVGSEAGKHESVDQKEYRSQDQRKALIIIGVSAGIGLFVALLVFFLP